MTVILWVTLSNFNTMKKDTRLHYLVREAKLQNEKTPLVILLHGVGSNEKDLFSFANQLPGNYLVVSARAPFELGRDSYAWYEVDFSSGKPVINKEKAEMSRKIIIDFIEELKKEQVFDETQVYLCGFSQGAIMAYSAGLTRPDKIKGIALMSGRLLEEVKPQIKSATELKNLEVFISHGTNDGVLGIHYAREARAYLKTLGLNPTYTEYPEGHSINKEMLTDLITWLRKG